MLLKALRAAAGDLEHPHDEEDRERFRGNAGRRPAGAAATSSSLADALLAVAEAFLAGKVAAADDPEVYQVIVHVGTDASHGVRRTDERRFRGDAGGRPAGARAIPRIRRRCHVEDGPALSVSTAQMLTCTAALSWMRHDRDGAVLDLGRRRRRPNAALRRAARERDKCRCRFPGCESRRVDLHHIQYWSNGGRTSLENLISLCKYHHMLVHDRGYLIAAARAARSRSSGRTAPACPPSPALPPPDGTIGDCHDADITPGTIIPAWYGERLDLDYAIYACFANARTPQERKEQRDQADDPELFRPTKWVIEPADWIRCIREHTAA